MTILVMKSFLICVSALLYRLGGADNYSKLYRRLGVPACILVNSLFISKLNVWLSLLSFVLLYGSLSLGYGVNSKLTKLFKNGYVVRAVVGLLCSIAHLPLLWNNWWLFGFYSIMLIVFWALNGNQLFRFEDKREEFAMGLFIATIPILN